MINIEIFTDGDKALEKCKQYKVSNMKYKFISGNRLQLTNCDSTPPDELSCDALYNMTDNASKTYLVITHYSDETC